MASRRRPWGVRAAGRPVAGALLLAVLAAACSGAADDGETEVLGIQVERTTAPAGTATPSVTTTPSPAPTPGSVVPPTPTSSPTADDPSPADAPQVAPPPPPPPPPPPAPSPSPPPSPSPAPSPSPSGEAEPVRLDSRTGHNGVTWFRDEEPDGQGGTRNVWGELATAPPATEDGTEPLRVRLTDLRQQTDPSEPRVARCVATIEVDGDRAVRAAGTHTVELVVDGVVVAARDRAIDVTVRPGERVEVSAAGDVEVRVPENERVTCAVRFTTDG